MFPRALSNLRNNSILLIKSQGTYNNYFKNGTKSLLNNLEKIKVFYIQTLDMPSHIATGISVAVFCLSLIDYPQLRTQPWNMKLK